MERYSPKQEDVNALFSFVLKSCNERYSMSLTNKADRKKQIHLKGVVNIDDLLNHWHNKGIVNTSRFYDLKNELKILLKDFNYLYNLEPRISYAMARQVLLHKEINKIRNWQRKARDDNFYRFKANLRASITSSVSKNRFYPSTEKILGCDLDTFVRELVAKSNKHTEIDHIVPMSLANNNDEAIALNHHSNLQVVSRQYNQMKKNKFIKKKNLDKVISKHRDPEIINKIVERSGIKII